METILKMIGDYISLFILVSIGGFILLYVIYLIFVYIKNKKKKDMPDLKNRSFSIDEINKAIDIADELLEHTNFEEKEKELNEKEEQLIENISKEFHQVFISDDLLKLEQQVKIINEKKSKFRSSATKKIIDLLRNKIADGNQVNSILNSIDENTKKSKQSDIELIEIEIEKLDKDLEFIQDKFKLLEENKIEKLLTQNSILIRQEVKELKINYKALKEIDKQYLQQVIEKIREKFKDKISKLEGTKNILNKKIQSLNNEIQEMENLKNEHMAIVEERKEVLLSYLGKEFEITQELYLVLIHQFKNFAITAVEGEYFLPFKNLRKMLTQEYDFFYENDEIKKVFRKIFEINEIDLTEILNPIKPSNKINLIIVSDNKEKFKEVIKETVEKNNQIYEEIIDDKIEFTDEEKEIQKKSKEAIKEAMEAERKKEEEIKEKESKGKKKEKELEVQELYNNVNNLLSTEESENNNEPDDNSNEDNSNLDNSDNNEETTENKTAPSKFAKSANNRLAQLNANKQNLNNEYQKTQFINEIVFFENITTEMFKIILNKYEENNLEIINNESSTSIELDKEQFISPFKLFVKDEDIKKFESTMMKKITPALLSKISQKMISQKIIENDSTIELIGEEKIKLTIKKPN